jgi:hypothetical protein
MDVNGGGGYRQKVSDPPEEMIGQGDRAQVNYKKLRRYHTFCFHKVQGSMVSVDLAPCFDGTSCQVQLMVGCTGCH